MKFPADTAKGDTPTGDGAQAGGTTEVPQISGIKNKECGNVRGRGRGRKRVRGRRARRRRGKNQPPKNDNQVAAPCAYSNIGRKPAKSKRGGSTSTTARGGFGGTGRGRGIGRGRGRGTGTGTGRGRGRGTARGRGRGRGSRGGSGGGGTWHELMHWKKKAHWFLWSWEWQERIGHTWSHPPCFHCGATDKRGAMDPAAHIWRCAECWIKYMQQEELDKVGIIPESLKIACSSDKWEQEQNEMWKEMEEMNPEEYWKEQAAESRREYALNSEGCYISP